ncbi:MAG: hypothetical protein IT335_12200 [Thermomicrobiales bacterium]|nr:hypothetical protein [Thermomicrobiales bacterium]
MDEPIFGKRIGRMVSMALLAILLGSGAGFVASGVTVTVSRTDIAAMQDSSTGGVRPGGFQRVSPVCIAAAGDGAESAAASS